MGVKLEKRDRIAHIIIDRPEKRNAFTFEMIKQMAFCWLEVENDSNIWVAILHAAGDHFSVGIDLDEVSTRLTDNDFEAMVREDYWRGTKTDELPVCVSKPVIAAVQGCCIGAGFSMVAACDLVIAAEDAVFSFPEIKVGMPTVTGCWWLSKKIPMNIALETVLLGEELTVQRAHQYG